MRHIQALVSIVFFALAVPTVFGFSAFFLMAPPPIFFSFSALTLSSPIFFHSELCFRQSTSRRLSARSLLKWGIKCLP